MSTFNVCEGILIYCSELNLVNKIVKNEWVSYLVVKRSIYMVSYLVADNNGSKRQVSINIDRTHVGGTCSILP